MTPDPAWTQPQELQEATSAQVRDELQQLIARNLLGPRDGETEQLPPHSRGPRDTYLVGALGPRTITKPSGATVIDRAEELADDTGTDGAVGGSDPDGDLPDILTPQTVGRMWPSSMGMSFVVDNRVEALAVTAEWGHYDKTRQETETGHETVWQRHPVHHDVEIDCTRDNHLPLPDSDEADGVRLQAEVRDLPGHRRLVRLSLINGRTEGTERMGSAWLFQSRLTVRALDGAAAIFRPIGDVTEHDTRQTDDEDAHLDLLYRDTLRHCYGHNVAVVATTRPEERCAHRITTNWLPDHEVPAVRPAAGAAGLVTDMDTLADLAESDDPAGLMAALTPLRDGYRAWLDTEETTTANLPDRLRTTARAAVDKARRAADRLADGIAVLRDDPQARRAFAFANRAMALQRRNTQLPKRRNRTGETYRQAYRAVAAEPGSAAWRPFQLGFVLVNLPSLADPTHPERGELVDLLFFPTGGGKTEAYLGLTAFTFAIRRLHGMVGSGAEARDGGDGVAVIMRYTLRMLTAQQFQRAAALVCAAEVLRRDDPRTWGAEPFRIGLWVGQSATPNWYDDDDRDIRGAKESGRRTQSLQLPHCPWCGTELVGSHNQETVPDRNLTVLYCPDGEAGEPCRFSRRGSAGQEQPGLPVLTVDELLYRQPPSLLIATVDKLAQLPWSGYAGMLLGRVTQRCPRHGYRHHDLDTRTGCGPRHRATATLPAATSRPVTRLRPPDLIIQDELHLISDALGTTVGLFENAVDELCTWQVDGNRAGPKIIASTATTKRAAEQVRQLYARDLAIFPPQVTDANNTWFSRAVEVTPDTPGRRYLGVCAHSWRMKAIEIRIAEILLTAGQALFDKYGAPADPYLTMVGYFSAIRELAGMRRLLDDVVTRIRGRQPDGLARRVLRNKLLTIEELTSRIGSGDINDMLDRIEEPFDPERHTTVRHSQIQAERADARRNKRREPRLPAPGHREPVDVVLATSMLQVGVDVDRLGLMVIAGQPKNTAEYIQASSRVGRGSGPGLVVTVYNWARPRDLAHFEDFVDYHRSYYRHVEALSVTPYSRRAIDRGAAATFVAAVRNQSDDWSVNRGAQDIDLDGPEVRALVDRMVDRADRAAGPRGAQYLRERIEQIKDEWGGERRADSRLGYRSGKDGNETLRGLIHSPDEGDWDTLTVGWSMRETENDINLLLPAGGRHSYSDGPAWGFPALGTHDDPGDHDEQ